MSEIKITVPTLGASWVPKIGGILAGLPILLTQAGFIASPVEAHYLSLVSGVGILILGLSAKQSNVHGGTVGQPSSPEARAAVNQDASSVKKGA